MAVNRKVITDEKSLLDEIVARIRDAIQPERIILFGSRARGTSHSGSDYDILVIKETDKPRPQRSAPLYALLSDLPVEVDVIVYTPEEVYEWSEARQAFVTTAVHEGIVLYEKAA